uniref:Costars domain-containing protein n=1 Tax=Clastoptera arizonana TaxID=38151 RepID=A0A1B6CIQ5_9HEMI
MTEAMELQDKVSKFNQVASQHLEAQSLNPFSDRFGSRSPSPRPKFSKDEYGKPVAGSLTELRGQKAYSHISREILDLCNVIHDVGKRQRKKREDEEEVDNPIIVTFGELFRIYTKISDKVVGLLIAAKKRGFVYFEGEILFQRRDDHVLIGLIKPIEEIRKLILSQTATPATNQEH